MVIESYLKELKHSVISQDISIWNGIQRLAIGSSNSITIYKLSFNISKKKFKRLCKIKEHSSAVNALQWSKDGDFLISGGSDHLVNIYAIDESSESEKSYTENWSCLYAFKGHDLDITSLSITPSSYNKHYLASTSLDNSVRVWSLSAVYSVISSLNKTKPFFRRVVSTPRFALTHHRSWAKSSSFDPQKKYFVTFGDDSNLFLYKISLSLENEIEKLDLIRRINEPFRSTPKVSYSRVVKFSPDGLFLLATHCFDDIRNVGLIMQRKEFICIFYFFITSIDEAARLVGHERTVNLVTFSPRFYKFNKDVSPPGARDKPAFTLLALCSSDAVSLWTPVVKRPLFVLRNTFQVVSVSFSPCGEYLLLFGLNGEMLVVNLDLNTPRKKKRRLSKVTEESTKTMSPSPKIFISGSGRLSTETINGLLEIAKDSAVKDAMTTVAELDEIQKEELQKQQVLVLSDPEDDFARAASFSGTKKKSFVTENSKSSAKPPNKKRKRIKPTLIVGEETVTRNESLKPQNAISDIGKRDLARETLNTVESVHRVIPVPMASSIMLYSESFNNKLEAVSVPKSSGEITILAENNRKCYIIKNQKYEYSLEINYCQDCTITALHLTSDVLVVGLSTFLYIFDRKTGALKLPQMAYQNKVVEVQVVKKYLLVVFDNATLSLLDVKKKKNILDKISIKGVLTVHSEVKQINLTESRKVFKNEKRRLFIDKEDNQTNGMVNKALICIEFSILACGTPVIKVLQRKDSEVELISRMGYYDRDLKSWLVTNCSKEYIFHGTLARSDSNTANLLEVENLLCILQKFNKSQYLTLFSLYLQRLIDEGKVERIRLRKIKKWTEDEIEVLEKFTENDTVKKLLQ
eukprot:snap_masked-scaffold_2-processed-gene-25.4-mRNA-1 protein AED:1.00 eAED:1.00 QI:0/0/0/0/1/1/3/0/861